LLCQRARAALKLFIHSATPVTPELLQLLSYALSLNFRGIAAY
jgi:hypothetical protein